MNIAIRTFLASLTAALALATASCGGGGGSATTPGGGLNLPPFRPSIPVVSAESFSDRSTAGDSAAERWLKNSVETLPSGGSIDSVYQNAALKQWADIILAGMNSERMARGLAPYKYEPHLALSAQAHARDMALRNYFSHDTPDGMTIGARLKALSPPEMKQWAENAAKGQESAQEVVSGWLASDKHREHMLSPLYDYAAVGVYFDASDPSMPVHVIADFASYYEDPAGFPWYQRGDVYK